MQRWFVANNAIAAAMPFARYYPNVDLMLIRHLVRRAPTPELRDELLRRFKEVSVQTSEERLDALEAWLVGNDLLPDRQRIENDERNVTLIEYLYSGYEIPLRENPLNPHPELPTELYVKGMCDEIPLEERLETTLTLDASDRYDALKAKPIFWNATVLENRKAWWRFMMRWWAVEWLLAQTDFEVANDVVSGEDLESFTLEDAPITKEEFNVMLTRYLDLSFVYSRNFVLGAQQGDIEANEQAQRLRDMNALDRWLHCYLDQQEVKKTVEEWRLATRFTFDDEPSKIVVDDHAKQTEKQFIRNEAGNRLDYVSEIENSFKRWLDSSYALRREEGSRPVTLANYRFFKNKLQFWSRSVNGVVNAVARVSKNERPIDVELRLDFKEVRPITLDAEVVYDDRATLYLEKQQVPVVHVFTLYRYATVDCVNREQVMSREVAWPLRKLREQVTEGGYYFFTVQLEIDGIVQAMGTGVTGHINARDQDLRTKQLYNVEDATTVPIYWDSDLLPRYISKRLIRETLPHERLYEENVMNYEAIMALARGHLDINAVRRNELRFKEIVEMNGYKNILTVNGSFLANAILLEFWGLITSHPGDYDFSKTLKSWREALTTLKDFPDKTVDTRDATLADIVRSMEKMRFTLPASEFTAIRECMTTLKQSTVLIKRKSPKLNMTLSWRDFPSNEQAEPSMPRLLIAFNTSTLKINFIEGSESLFDDSDTKSPKSFFLLNYRLRTLWQQCDFPTEENVTLTELGRKRLEKNRQPLVVTSTRKLDRILNGYFVRSDLAIRIGTQLRTIVSMIEKASLDLLKM